MIVAFFIVGQGAFLYGFLGDIQGDVNDQIIGRVSGFNSQFERVQQIAGVMVGHVNQMGARVIR